MQLPVTDEPYCNPAAAAANDPRIALEPRPASWIPARHERASSGINVAHNRLSLTCLPGPKRWPFRCATLKSPPSPHTRTPCNKACSQRSGKQLTRSIICTLKQLRCAGRNDLLLPWALSSRSFTAQAKVQIYQLSQATAPFSPTLLGLWPPLSRRPLTWARRPACAQMSPQWRP